MIAPAMTPGNRQAKACDPTSIEAEEPAAGEQEKLLAVLGRVFGLDVRRDGDGDEAVGRLRVREDRAGVARGGVGLDHVHGPRPGRGRAGREAQDVDHLRGTVVDDVRTGTGERGRPVDTGPSFAGRPRPRSCRTSGRRRCRRSHRPGCIQPGHEGHAVRSALLGHRHDDRPARRIHERDALRGRSRDASDLGDDDPRQRPVPDGQLHVGPRLGIARAAEDDRIAAGQELRLDRAGIAADEVGQGRRDGRRVVHLGRRPDQGRSGPTGCHVHQLGQVELGGDRAGGQVHGREPVARGDHDTGPVVQCQELVHPRADARPEVGAGVSADVEAAEAHRLHIDRRDPASSKPTMSSVPVSLMASAVAPGAAIVPIELAGPQVERVDLGAGGDVQALAGPPGQVSSRRGSTTVA